MWRAIKKPEEASGDDLEHFIDAPDPDDSSPIATQHESSAAAVAAPAAAAAAEEAAGAKEDSRAEAYDMRKRWAAVFGLFSFPLLAASRGDGQSVKSICQPGVQYTRLRQQHLMCHCVIAAHWLCFAMHACSFAAAFCWHLNLTCCFGLQFTANSDQYDSL